MGSDKDNWWKEPLSVAASGLPNISEVWGGKQTSDRKLLIEASKRLSTVLEGTSRGPWVPYPTPTVGGSVPAEDETGWTITRPHCSTHGGDMCEEDCAKELLRTGGEGCEEDYVSMPDVHYMCVMNPIVGRQLSVLFYQAALSLTPDDLPLAQLVKLAKAVLGHLDENGNEYSA